MLGAIIWSAIHLLTPISYTQADRIVYRYHEHHEPRAGLGECFVSRHRQIEIWNRGFHRKWHLDDTIELDDGDDFPMATLSGPYKRFSVTCRDGTRKHYQTRRIEYSGKITKAPGVNWLNRDKR